MATGADVPPAGGWAMLRPGWHSLRRMLRPPRRLRFTRAGLAFTGGTLAIGLASINTGNNLLYLLLGAALGFIALSGWLSEQSLRRVSITRRVPRGATVGRATRVLYVLSNRKRRMSSFALEITERELPGARAFVVEVPPNGSATARLEIVFHRRGRYSVDELTLATSYPFGFFTKSRDLASLGSFLVWPRHDLPLREPRTAGLRARRRGSASAPALGGGRGEFRGLRDYRSGDDPRDVHWPSSARAGEPVVRDFERDDSDVIWICLDPDSSAGDRGERAVEIAASLAAGAARRGRRFGLATAEATITPGTGEAQLGQVLDLLARVELSPGAPLPPLPAAPESCVLVSATRDDTRFGDRFLAEPA